MAGKRGVSHERHGYYGTPEYRAWAKMIARCTCTSDRAYADYGGRGITVCDRWRRSFSAFLADMGERPSPAHSIDRFPDNNGSYEPGNCRWATRKEQNGNTRKNRRLTLGERTMTMTDWAAELGIRPSTLHYRLSKMPLAQALLMPRQHG